MSSPDMSNLDRSSWERSSQFGSVKVKSVQIKSSFGQVESSQNMLISEDGTGKSSRNRASKDRSN